MPIPKIVLFDHPTVSLALRPFTDTRPIAGLRIGIFTIIEKWKNSMPGTYNLLTHDYLQPQYPITDLGTIQARYTTNILCIDSSVLPNARLVEALQALKKDEVLMTDSGCMIAFWKSAKDIPAHAAALCPDTTTKQVVFKHKITRIKEKWDIFLNNPAAIEADFSFILQHKKDQGSVKDPNTICYHPTDIWVAPTARIQAAILNAEKGPIYIGENAIVHPQSVITGPVAIGNNACIHVGSHISGGTSIGSYAKVGGEVNQSVIFDYSNKAHSGFLGHSVIGSFCNIGSGTNTSNLRNDYGEVTLWDYKHYTYVKTGLQFCGLFMGDFSKCGIQTMFNTGTTVGISTSIAGAGFCNRFIPSFMKGSPLATLSFYELHAAIEAAERTLARRQLVMQQTQKDMFAHLLPVELEKWFHHIVKKHAI